MVFYQCPICREVTAIGENHECKKDYYKKRIADISLEQKRKDLEIHPMINKEKIKYATDDEIEEVYFQIFSTFDMSMQDILGESMFDEN
jgi:hypothetical protein